MNELYKGRFGRDVGQRTVLGAARRSRRTVISFRSWRELEVLRQAYRDNPRRPYLHAMRDEVSYARMVGVEGLPSSAAAAAATG